MPYITEEDKKKLAFRDDKHPENAGELTYVLYKTCLQYVIDRGLKYLNLCTVVGSLICCTLELYRKICSPYEDKKIEENGDVT